LPGDKNPSGFNRNARGPVITVSAQIGRKRGGSQLAGTVKFCDKGLLPALMCSLIGIGGRKVVGRCISNDIGNVPPVYRYIEGLIMPAAAKKGGVY